MHVKTLSIRHVSPSPYNPRIKLKPGSKHHRKLKASLERFGLVEPLVWNQRTGHLVGGHQRFHILQELGWTDVPVSIVDLDEHREKALNVVLNNREAQSDWDTEKLSHLLTELENLPEPLLPETGFDASHAKLLREELKPDEAFVTEEEKQEMVEITLHVPPERFQAVRTDVDSILEKHGLECHMKRI